MITKILKPALVIIFIVSFSLQAQDNLEKGIGAVKRGDYVQALELLKGVSKDSYEANLYYGIALFRTGSLGEAEKFIKSAVSKDNERPEAYSILGEIYTEQKKYSEAALKFESSKKFLPLTKTKDELNKEEIELIISVLKAESESFIANGKVDKAIASLTTAKIYDDKNPLIYVGLGDAYYARGAFEPAKTNYDQALKYKAGYAPALYGIGKIAFKKKKYSDALDNFLRATDSDNNFAPAFFEKGLIFYYLDKFNDAIEAFERYDKLVPGSPRGKTYLAKAYFGKRDCEKSKQILDEVLAKDPNYSEANKYYAYCLIESKEYGKAEQYFEKVKPEDLNSEDWIKKAEIHLKKEEFSQAYDDLNKATSMDSLEPNIYFEYGKALFAEQKYPEAVEKFNKSIELGQLNIGVYVYSGICYFYMKEYQSGIDIISKCIDKDPSIKSSYLWRANNYVGMNKNAEACADYKKFLEFEPDDQFVKDQVTKLCEVK